MRKVEFCRAAVAVMTLGAGIALSQTRLQPVTNAAGYIQAMSAASRITRQKLHLPTLIPVGGKIFAYYDAGIMVPNLQLISFDRTKDCHGVHVCTLGSFQVSAQPIEMLKDMEGQVITRRLADGSFFTPEHVMADSFPAQLQWRKHGQTYTITWSGLPTRDAPATLQAMKRSATTSRRFR